jgi:uncharacterized OB-fold protein
MKSKSEIIDVQTVPYVANFSWSTGFLVERFIKELVNRKIMAVKCPGCGYTYVPPRSRCGRCYSKIGEKNLITLSGKGTLVGYTTAYVELDGQGNFVDVAKPAIIGSIKLDGADSMIFIPIEEIKPHELADGMRVEAQWQEETKGELSDIKCFKPAR